MKCCVRELAIPHHIRKLGVVHSSGHLHNSSVVQSSAGWFVRSLSTCPPSCAALLCIPLAQEGPKAALAVAVKSVLLGPAAALSLYFAERERAYLDVALRANPVL